MHQQICPESHIKPKWISAAIGVFNFVFLLFWIALEISGDPYFGFCHEILYIYVRAD